MNAVTKSEISGPVSHLPAFTPLTMIERALERGADIAMIEKLMELQRSHEANQSRCAFDQAIAAAKAEFRPIGKSGTVSHGQGKASFGHETLADIAEAVDAALSRYGLHYRYRVEQGDRISVTCIIAHKDGHSETTTLSGAPDASGAKNSIQAIGSTVTYLQRYTLKAALGLSAARDDDGGAADQRIGNENISLEQYQELAALIERAGVEEKIVLNAANVSALDFLPARQFLTIRNKLLATIKVREGK